MEFQDAKSFLIKAYLGRGMELVKDELHQVTLKTKYFSNLILLTKDEIEEYAELENQFPEFVNEPCETSILSNNYREQVIKHINEQITGPFLTKSPFLFGAQQTDQVYIEIGVASNLFMNFSLRSENFMQNYCKPNVMSLETKTTHDLLRYPMTIKIFNMNCEALPGALLKSNQLIDGCMFDLAYLKGYALETSSGWSKLSTKNKIFENEETISGKKLPLANNFYNEDTLKFYMRGASSEDPINKFLSFYQVLEYFFVQVSDEHLYDKLSRKINDPKFVTSPSNLDKIIQDTLEHKRETDETEMLRLVLEKYVSEKDILEFVSKYEEFLTEKLYSKNHKIFGKQFEMKLQSGHVFKNLASRIKAIRNALVHSSDRYEREERYIPSKDSEQLIFKEVPLLKFLSEKIIIATSGRHQ